MAMKRRGGTRSKIVVEKMLNVFDLHFPTPAVEAMSRICACKTERNLQIFGWCLQFKQSCLWATLSYFCLQNKAGKSTQWGESSQKMYQKSSALSIRFECEEVSLQIEFTTLPPKTTTSLWKLKRTGNWRKRNCGHRLIMHSITRREGGGVGWSEKTVGGGEAGGSFT